MSAAGDRLSPGFSRITSKEQNGVIQPILTDLYQITMAYAYWKSGKMHNRAVFDLYFRKNPFRGEFTVFAGLEECVKFLQNFRFTSSDIEYLKRVLPDHIETEFFDYLGSISTKDVCLSAIDEGTVVFPKVPLLIIEGPLPIVQLMETPLLNLINYARCGTHLFHVINYASLVATNGMRFRLAAGPKKTLLEFGLRRAQGPDGALSASRYCYLGDFLPDQVISGELAAFIAYATSFPDGFLALIDTYDVIKSGVPNFCTVAMALHQLGYEPRGIRLDSGDLSYLSKLVRDCFKKVADHNDINEDTIHSLNQQLVEIDSKPRIKLSEDVEKVTIPGRKIAYRLYGSDGNALVDLMLQPDEKIPGINQRILCRNPFQESKRAYVCPAHVEKLHKVYWKNGEPQLPLPSLQELRTKALNSLHSVRQDHKRALNPTPYKVSVSSKLYTFMHNLWLDNAPIGELS
ncbi:hypothetical protein KUTeg_000638 [Tegillarca granosa]|uniref:nicotinate phosphoribosyltransferase n=1 Tax=Tegillarca granosa TaxID=220873 RepID=A0ABQ9G1I9_TEGGR|nr:hypothetical protein KUTeg_000638 [Tegillarca granosa]